MHNHGAIPSWFLILRGILRVLFPLMISFVPRVVSLWVNGQLTLQTFMQGPGFLLFPATLSIMLLIDLLVLSQGVPITQLNWPTPTLMTLYFVAFVIAVVLYTLHVDHEIRGLVDLGAYMAMRKLESVGGCISVLLIALDVIATVLEVKKKIPAVNRF